MSNLLKPSALLLCTFLLASCGGEAPSDPPVVASTVKKSSQQALVPADFHEVVQRVYVSYFGRPADPAGLDFFAANYLAAGAPNNIDDVSAAYASNAAVRDLLNAFGTSAESQALYPGDNTQFITAIYSNLFNRAPDGPGLEFWVARLNAADMTRAQAAVAIMAGSQGTDDTLISMKIKVASDFTTALDTDPERAAYSGLAANVVVRNMMGTVTLATDVNNFQGTINATIAALAPPAPDPAALFAQVQGIILQRCAGCHSARPTIPGFNPAPLGIRYDTATQINNDKARIAAVVSVESMPYGNLTNMTDAERATVAQWYESVR